MRPFHALGAVALVGLAANALAQFQVKKTADNCRNAHAVLVASRSGEHALIWREIRRTIDTKNKFGWQLVDEHEPGVMYRFSLRQYDTKYVAGGSAYVAHCGHGGTCNALADAFFADHPNWNTVEVYCGEVPEWLTNPQRPQ
jgi:hypothetical protein